MPNTKKKQGNTTPKKQQDKSLEINLKEIELHELHDRIQNNHHEDAFWTQENNGQNENINKEIENIRKNQAEIWGLNKWTEKFTRGVQKQVDKAK